MSYEQKPNSGSLFHAEKKSDRHPDYNGSIDVDGIPYWIAGWRKKSANNIEWLSLQLTLKTPADAVTNSSENEFDDVSDIPF